jgi:MFS family permease
MFKDKKISLETYVLLSVLLGNFLVAFVSNVVPIALPQMALTYNLSNILQNWVSNAFLLSIAVFSIPFGKLCDRYGLRNTFLLSLIIFLLGAIGTPLATSTGALFSFRVIQGLASAIINVSAMALLIVASPKEKRGKYIGLNISIIYVAISLAPVIGGILTYNLGWQSIFYLSVPFIILNIWLVSKIDKEWITGRDEKFDLNGSIIYSIAIVIFMFGFTILNTLIGQIITIIGVILLISFAVYELKNKNPIFDVKLFKNVKFLTSNFAYFVSFLATFVVTLILNYHLQYILGWNSQNAGLFLIITPAVIALIGSGAGYLADKVEPQKLASMGMAFVTVALILFSFLNKNTNLYYIAFAMVLQGIGIGFFSSPNITTIMSSVPASETGMASASVSAMRVIGQTMSVGLLTLIFAFIMGNVVITPKVYHGLIVSCQYAFIISTILCVFALIASVIGIFTKSELY